MYPPPDKQEQERFVGVFWGLAWNNAVYIFIHCFSLSRLSLLPRGSFLCGVKLVMLFFEMPNWISLNTHRQKPKKRVFFDSREVYGHKKRNCPEAMYVLYFNYNHENKILVLERTISIN